MPPSDGSRIPDVRDGVLLYYKYVPIPEVPLIVKWYEDLCTSLGLVGRIRVSPEGVNVTIGGSTVALEEHIKQVSSHPSLGSCDFKVAHCSEPLLANPVLVLECGFDSLSVRAVKIELAGDREKLSFCNLVIVGSHNKGKKSFKMETMKMEVVSLGGGASHASCAVAGTHLSPAEFHQHLLAAATGQSETFGRPNEKKSGVVVLDARNVYETRIGRFQQLPGVEFYDPRIRQFSDLPAWLDANEDRLRYKHVYMYCTGGVRCERASAYLRVKGPAFQNVNQLSGGIQRYLEAFPEGGLFAGKNFVFDPRVAVGSTDARKVGRCLLCRSPFDDYSPRCRCSQCRLLVLVCGDCRERPEPAAYVCELCQDAKTESRAALENESGGELTNRKLDAASGLGSKSGDVSVEHGPATESVRSVVTIPPDRRNGEADGQDGRVLGSSSENGTDPFADGASVRTGSHWEEALSGGLTPRRRLRVLCLHGFRQTGRGLKGRLAAFQRKLGDLLELVFVDGPFQLPCVYYSGGLDGGEGGDQTGSGEGAKSTDRSVLGAAGFEDKGSEEATCERTREGVRAERGAEGGVRDRGVSPRVERVSRGGECSVGEAADCTDAATFGSGVGMPGSAESQKQAPGGPFPKFAWLVSPEQLREIRRSVESSGKNGESAVRGHPGGDAHAKECGETATVELRLEESAAWKGEAPGEVKEASRGAGGADWKPASARFGPLQYLTQTAGWETSLAHLRRIVSEQGPFDGVLGFSQGAAVAAALCRYSTTAKALGDENAFAFRFAVLCSGFLSPAEGRQEANRHLIDLPSLHVFGSLKGNDRQIEVAESERLAERFEPRHRVVVRHSAGHIIPISKSHVNQYKSFFLKTF